MDEGVYTYIMAIFCWWALGFLELVMSTTELTYFYGMSFDPHVILPPFDIQLVRVVV